jgi:hypothetical protein
MTDTRPVLFRADSKQVTINGGFCFLSAILKTLDFEEGTSDFMVCFYGLKKIKHIDGIT